MSRKFTITGRRRLEGEYRVQGNKNAALPLIAASLLCDQPVIFENIPRILDVENLVQLLESVGVRIQWDGDSLLVDPRSLEDRELPDSLVAALRGAVLLLGPLVSRWGRISCARPGGCQIGRRSFDVHWSAFRSAGYSVEEGFSRIQIEKDRSVDRPSVYLEESSVTATENALLIFAALGQGVIENPAREPHVLSLVDFLRRLGCEIELHPIYFQIRKGIQPQEAPVRFSVPPDYIDAGTIAIASAVTGGSVTLQGITRQEMVGIQSILERFGIEFHSLREDAVRVSARLQVSPEQVIAGPWPLFPTDLVSLAIVLATQSKGLCLIHDWMYEARMFFVDKLVRMGAHITMCDPHRVLVEGPKRLRGTRLESPDIRAGMALFVAGLCAEGTTVIEHAEVIQRGYENVAERLSAIGARIREE